MIYLDNAATTYPKPPAVIKAVNNTFAYSANPGRAGHKMSIKASEILYGCRERIGKLLNFDITENIILLPSCTMALNTVIKGTLERGDHVVISSLEHNSVLRPLKRLADDGIITFDVAKVYEKDMDATVDSFRKLIRDNTKLCVCTHASNVFGVKLPVSQICALCHYYGVLFCIDAAQSMGVVDIDISDIDADYICSPGHKGLYAPMGTGFLIVNSDRYPTELIEGGTGSSSIDDKQPSALPDRYESGTVNLSGFAGLSAGIDFVNRKRINVIRDHEMKLIRYLYDELSGMKDVILYTSRPETKYYVPILSFNIKDVDCDVLSQQLDRKYGIALRSGIHCSPLAHSHFGTQDIGTVRVSPSVFTDEFAVKSLINVVFQVIKNKKIFI